MSLLAAKCSMTRVEHNSDTMTVEGSAGEMLAHYLISGVKSVLRQQGAQQRVKGWACQTRQVLQKVPPPAEHCQRGIGVGWPGWAGLVQ